MAEPRFDHPHIISEEPEETLGAPVDAPFGLKQDGTPKLRPGGRPAGRKNGPPPRKTAPAPAARKPTNTAPRAKRKNYAPLFSAGIELSLQLTSSPRIPEVYKHDLAVLYLDREPLSTSANELTHHLIKRFPKLGEWMDKAAALGPTAVGASALTKTFAQLLHNHKLLPPAVAALCGVQTPEELGQRMRADIEKRMRAQGLDPATMAPPQAAEPEQEPQDLAHAS